MSTIWTPQIRTPQLGEAAKAITLDRAFGIGLLSVAIQSWEELVQRDPPLGEYVEKLGAQLDGANAEGINVNIPASYDDRVEVQGFWALGVLKMSAGIALAAYREAGYFAQIDEEAIETGSLFADIGGVPDSFGVSSHEDASLLKLVGTISSAPDLNEVVMGSDPVKVQTTLYIGAGCTRHYLQQALQLAA